MIGKFRLFLAAAVMSAFLAFSGDSRINVYPQPFDAGGVVIADGFAIVPEE